MALGSRGKNVELRDQDLCNSPIDLDFLIRARVKRRTMFCANYLKLLLRSFFEPAVADFGAF